MPRDRQRGNSLLLALIVMSALATLGTLTVVSVQSSLKASTNDRFQNVAQYAAESGVAAAMLYLRTYHATNGTFVGANPGSVFRNGVPDGNVNNPFTADQHASYTISFVAVPKVATAGPPPTFTADPDRVLIRSTGLGPQGSVSIVEWDVRWDTKWFSTHGVTASHGLQLMHWRVIDL